MHCRPPHIACVYPPEPAGRVFFSEGGEVMKLHTVGSLMIPKPGIKWVLTMGIPKVAQAHDDRLHHHRVCCTPQRQEASRLLVTRGGCSSHETRSDLYTCASLVQVYNKANYPDSPHLQIDVFLGDSGGSLPFLIKAAEAHEISENNYL